jgi:transposase
MAHCRGENRDQATLFPVLLDELVETDALVRVIDAWVASLKLSALGFARAQAAAMGRPPYDPSDLLKLYLWGYLGSLRSSRALERECQRNVECMWLLGRLAPDHKTIADFRRHHPHALVAVCAAFVQFARREQLIAATVVAIDGSKIRAVASRKALGTLADLESARQQLDAHIQHYLTQLDSTDAEDAAQAPVRGKVTQTLHRLRQRQAAVQQDVERLSQSESTLSVLTEPDARAMKSLHGAPGYNLQTAVDSESHLIVHHEVCNDATDLRQLAPMAQGCVQALEVRPMIVADAGYASGAQLQALQERDIVGYVAEARAVNNQGDGSLYDRTAFHYDPVTDTYTCPADHRLTRKQLSRKDHHVIYTARAQDCGPCPLKPRCTLAQQRFVSRHLNEAALQANARRLADAPHMMALRRQTVEHPFGTIKHQIMGNARLLARGFRGARAELSLAVMAYNFKRVFNMKGSAWMLQAMRA